MDRETDTGPYQHGVTR